VSRLVKLVGYASAIPKQAFSRHNEHGCLVNYRIFERLGLDAQQWLTLTTGFEKHFGYAARAELMMNACKHHTHHQPELNRTGFNRIGFNRTAMFKIIPVQIKWYKLLQKIHMH
jgi:hypothetical protein